MDITPQDTTTQPISDDQELAKALAGVLPDDPSAPVVNAVENTTALQFEETPVPAAPVQDETPVVPDETPVIPAFEVPEAPAVDETPSTSSSSSDLEGIKNDAIQELRPLIDHVDLPAEEKFDTYLLLIRSTDDSSLIGPAHTAAQAITDDKRKAEALLDIIKEIDYLSKKDQAA
ncbi:MAG: hypothetical protein V4611_02315 [Patescibacteria group bacterium]